MPFSPSLFFTTNCEEALAFYERWGLGRGTVLLRWGENDMPVRTEAMRGKVLHARFEGPGILFHASDNDDAKPMKGSALMLEFDDLLTMRALFGNMAEDGRIMVPLARRYWGTSFGMLVDAFGVQWIFSCSSE
ncbi:MAG: glyoxalase/bleomycin resistance/extradiol dioxygenase family protein [Mesorhizobium sp.]|uniref:glyoxalase/bleomycin resistance/extradiol dioxygenase family protein n=1 Tax=Mesorhizobium sp. TaxID=1871066 RepID=UPI000FEA97A5|nr:glyoxalase/bleomycin resistance/extradiol dioxygenase family protein [Mesorhizobium sp.]RWM11709.1 MAG: glyoxalase/bleomycin resistance/extradiol dioxygenase family protein [Mesorhizobium sp.]TIO53246.1 MAG: glyoxalase/bleomycin resistance/extradiol dioxygenase family protein [Mesorhizobium sp.]TIO62213.1 MAG: glyoxalase/bleomycin resistance/extradiol dioxygenase family protein [Mesorhizobium sp.]TJV66923.1 MAG: glyoxalase/bleomycin resistance/extradiol dioxygenase family protein [Mesorhizob